MNLLCLPTKLCDAVTNGEILSINVSGIDAALPLFYKNGEVIISAHDKVTEIICDAIFTQRAFLDNWHFEHSYDIETLKDFLNRMFDFSKLYLTMDTMGTKDGLNIYDMLKMVKTKAFQVELEELEFRNEYFTSKCRKFINYWPAQNMARHIKREIKAYVNDLLLELDDRLYPTYECSGRIDQVLFFFELMHCLDIDANAKDPDWKFTTKGD